MIHCSEGFITLFYSSQKLCLKDSTPGRLAEIAGSYLKCFHVM